MLVKRLALVNIKLEEKVFKLVLKCKCIKVKLIYKDFNINNKFLKFVFYSF